MQFLFKGYLRFTWLSLDVVLGAIAGLAFFSELLQVDLGWEIYVLLGLAVWSIYTVDHLLDAQRRDSIKLSPRHQFHRDFKWPLIISLGLTVLTGLWFAFHTFGWDTELLWSMILGGLILSSMVLIRFSGQSMAWVKELSIAVFYVLGIAWIPLLRGEELDRNIYSWVFLVAYGGLALINLLMLSYLDRSQDKAAGFPSSAALVSPAVFLKGLRKGTFGFIIICLAGFILFPSFYRPFACILLLMGLLHYLAFFNPKLSKEQVRMRTEAAFLLPLLLLIF